MGRRVDIASESIMVYIDVNICFCHAYTHRIACLCVDIPTYVPDC